MSSGGAGLPPGLPGWLRPLAAARGSVVAAELGRWSPPGDAERRSAVLVLLGEGGTPDGGPDVLLIERAHHLRHHAGQPAFPGGMVDPGDDGPVAAALREAVEETGLDPAGVVVIGELPPLWLPPSRTVVVPVLAWWRAPSPVAAVDPAEVAAVRRVAVAELVDPARRLRTRHPVGHVGPAFALDDLFVWGFTAMLLDRVLRVGGFERPWEAGRVVPLPAEALAPAGRGAAAVVDERPGGAR